MKTDWLPGNDLWAYALMYTMTVKLTYIDGVF